MRKRIMRRNLGLGGLLLAGLVLLGGCNMSLVNLTPETHPANPSNVYTLTLEVNHRSGAVDRESISPQVVIDGQMFPMSPAAVGENLFEFDYRLPPGRDRAAYYYLVRYDIVSDGRRHQREEHSAIHNLAVVNRYALSLEVDRAPAGSRVALVGRGFSRSDQVFVGGEPAETVFESPTSLAFFLPALPAGRTYQVTLRGAESTLNAGSIRIDEGRLRVVPESLSLTTGARRMLVFTLPSEAPPGGLLIPVTTDVPDSVIMPEVIVPAGSRSVNIPIEGGSPGSGNLYVEAAGFEEIIIPVTIRRGDS